MADPELGTKQVCPSCEVKFYDLNKRPATCPKCAHSFDPEDAQVQATKTKVRTQAAKAAVPEDEDDDTDEDVVAATKTSGDDDEEENSEEVAKELGGDEDEVALDMSGDSADDEESTSLGKVPAGFSEEGVDDDDDVPGDDDDEEEFGIEGDDIDIDDGNKLGEPDADDVKDEN